MSSLDSIAATLSSARRIVVKIGTNSLGGDQEGLNLELIDQLAGQIAELRSRDLEVILVSSGAVGAGAYALGFRKPPTRMNERQALAAVGQSRMMQRYRVAFQKFGVEVAQVLLTRDSLDDRERYLNTRNTLETLLEWGILPIVNENDTVSTEELRISDNDLLSALISGKMGADLLILLTDVDALYDRPPGEPGARPIQVMTRRRFSQVKTASPTAGSFALGGMSAKLKAAELAIQSGILVNISSAGTPSLLTRLMGGETIGTWFEPDKPRVAARKRWLILGTSLGDGRVIIDGGARSALLKGGKSLLPSGVTKVEGRFQAGELIRICAETGTEIARGKTRFSSVELDQIRGRKTGEIAPILGKRPTYEVVHRDDMVITE